MPIKNKKITRLAVPALAISFIATLIVVQNPLLNILLICPLVVFLTLAVKQVSGSAIPSFMVMALSMGAALLNVHRMADQSVELYVICESQMNDGGAVAADVPEGSDCAERYIAPDLWRLKA